MKIKAKISALAIAAAALLLLSACGGNGQPGENTAATTAQNSSTAAVTTGQNQSYDPTVRDDGVYALHFKEVYITPNRPFAAVIDKIGQYNDSNKSLGCMFTDEEWEYYYDHFLVCTYRDGGVDYVGCIQFTDDVITTTEGVKIGMEAAQTVTLLGNDFEDRMGTHVYRRGDTELWITIANGAVKNIAYYAVYD